MKKAFIIFLSLIGFLHISAPPKAEAITWDGRWFAVRFQTLQPGHFWTDREVRLTIQGAARKFGVSRSGMLCTANRETGGTFDERAYNRSSGASGLFQHLSRYWPGRVAAYNVAMRRAGRDLLLVGTNPFGARANALVTAWMIRTEGWGPWSGRCT